MLFVLFVFCLFLFFVFVFCFVFFPFPHTCADGGLIARAEREDVLADGISITEHIFILHNELDACKLGHADLKLDLLLVPRGAEAVVRHGLCFVARDITIHTRNLHLHKRRRNATRGLDQVPGAQDLHLHHHRVDLVRVRLVVVGVELVGTHHLGFEHIAAHAVLAEAAVVQPHRAVCGRGRRDC